jgi:hypothetical protein
MTSMVLGDSTLESEHTIRLLKMKARQGVTPCHPCDERYSLVNVNNSVDKWIYREM